MVASKDLAFADARERIAAIREGERDIVDDQGHTRVYLHDRPATTSVVLIHGLTSSPRQFDDLARQCFDRGANVYLPRLPYHGLRDPHRDEIRLLSEEDLAVATNEAITIASALGDEIVVGGISLGGTLAALAAQLRPDVRRALLIAPLFSVHVVPAPLNKRAADLLRSLPIFFLWWDPIKRDRQSPPGSYPKFSTHALAACLELAATIDAMSRQEAPQSRTQIALVNAKDPAVNNNATRSLLNNWRQSGGTDVRGYKFSRTLPPLHDFITPERGSSYAPVVDPLLLRFLLSNS